MSAPGEEKTTQCSICHCIWCKKVLPQRYVLTILLFTCPIVLYIQRVCLAIAIINMTKWVSSETGPVTCPAANNQTDEEVPMKDHQFDWDEAVQSYILLSFFIGYMIGNFSVGFALSVINARWILWAGVLASSAMTAILPLLAYHLHWGFICAARVIAGIGQAPLFACSSMLISRWILEKNKSSTSTLVWTSFTIGIVIGNVGSGFIMVWTQTWCWVFYIFGGLGFIWAAAFFFYGYPNPQAHPHISPAELQLLETIPRAPKMAIPFKSILSDLSVWMFFLAYFGSDFTVYLIVTNMPKYFANVLGFSTTETGTILMGPPTAGAIGGFVFGFTADFIINRKYLKKMTFRMICSVIGLPLPAMLLLVMVYMECNRLMASILVIAAMFLQAAYYAGVGIMAVDLTLNYGGLMYGFANVAGGFAGSIAPYLVGNIAYLNTFPQWRIVTYITSLIAILALIPILMFSKAERRIWDYGPDEEKPSRDDATACKKIWSCYKPV